MKIGVPKEIKKDEYRVGLTPDAVHALCLDAHSVLIEKGAGLAAGFTDEMYKKAGAQIAQTPQEIYATEMVIKVKEPQEQEMALMHKGLLLFCYLHLAPDPKQTKALLEKEVIAIAYETIQDAQGRLPLLIPMSEIAGRFAIQAGASALQIIHGGKGVLLGGIPGVRPGKVVILGAGIVGTEAMRMALGLGANVTIFDKNLHRLRELDQRFAPALKTLFATPAAIEAAVCQADLVIGAVLIPGKTAPRLVTKEMVKKMERGSAIVDVAIDQGGCIETARPTTHSHPFFEVDGVIHYGVTNMPAACAKTSTQGLVNATLPYSLRLAKLGFKRAMREDPSLMLGLNVCEGKITYKAVAEDLGYPYHPPESLIEA